MNPYDEKRLRDEVIYLHYLWHQGPPQNPKPNTTTHKRPRLFTQNPTKKAKWSNLYGSDRPPKPDQGRDWSTLVDPTLPSSASSSGWPEFTSKTEHHQTQPLSAEDEAKFVSLRIQSKVLEHCKQFFMKRVDDDDDDDDDDGEEEEKFFMDVFVNNSELRGYYDENYDNGEFVCLVCGGICEHVGKRFKGCVGLVQHCMSISKTKGMRGHRAFGLIICKVLGWDITRLPVILFNGEPLSQTLAKLKESQSNVDDLNVNLGTDECVNVYGSQSVEKEVSAADKSNGELMISENSSVMDDAVKNAGNLEISDAEQNKEAANDLVLDSSQRTGSEWPCIGFIDDSTSRTMGWPSFKPYIALNNRVVPAVEQIRFNMGQLQQNVFEACRKFFSTNGESDSDEDDNETIEYEDGLTTEEGSKDCKEFNFFLRLFIENDELRTYYENNYRNGDFCCLVCYGIGKKVWRTFKDCVGLLQHSTAISKTRRKQAHQAFGLVVCKVLGWDFDHLPSIILKGKPLSHSLKDLRECPLDGKALSNANKLDTANDKSDFLSASKEDTDAHLNNTNNSLDLSKCPLDGEAHSNTKELDILNDKSDSISASKADTDCPPDGKAHFNKNEFGAPNDKSDSQGASKEDTDAHLNNTYDSLNDSSECPLDGKARSNRNELDALNK